MNLIERIAAEMTSDLQNETDDQSCRLLILYLTGTDETRAALDAAFVCLCGYRLETLIEMDDDDEEPEEEDEDAQQDEEAQR